MAKGIDLPTKLTAAGLALALLVFLFGDNIAGRLGLVWHGAQEEELRAEEPKPPPAAIKGTAASTLTVLVNAGTAFDAGVEFITAVNDLNKGLLIAADALPKPVLIRYVRPSTTNSGRAICVAVYDPRSWLPRAHVISERKNLARYLGECSFSVSNRNPSEDLPLSKAIEIAARAAPLRAPRRTLIILSRFKAPFEPDERTSSSTLHGVRAMLIEVGSSDPGRDGAAGSETEEWRDALQRRGAEVTTFDTSILDAPTDLAVDIVG